LPPRANTCAQIGSASAAAPNSHSVEAHHWKGKHGTIGQHDVCLCAAWIRVLWEGVRDLPEGWRVTLEQCRHTLILKQNKKYNDMMIIYLQSTSLQICHSQGGSGVRHIRAVPGYMTRRGCASVLWAVAAPAISHSPGMVEPEAFPTHKFTSRKANSSAWSHAPRKKGPPLELLLMPGPATSRAVCTGLTKLVWRLDYTQSACHIALSLWKWSCMHPSPHATYLAQSGQQCLVP
jgi:hypothetical protein